MTGPKKTRKPALGVYLRDPDTPMRDQIRAAIADNPGSFVRDISEALAKPDSGKTIRQDVMASVDAIYRRDEISRTRGMDERTGQEAWRYYPADMGEFRFSSPRQIPEIACTACGGALPPDRNVRRVRCDPCQDAFLEEHKIAYHRRGEPYEERMAQYGNRGTRKVLKIFIPDEPPRMVAGKRTGTWRTKKVLEWEKAHGPVPSGYRILVLDGDPENLALDNLACVPRNTYAAFHRMGEVDTTEAGRLKLTILQTNTLIKERRDEFDTRS